jgi:hypothetical protein
MLSGVDWLGVFKSVKDDVIWPAFKGFWDGLMSDGKNLLIGTLGKVGSWFKESFWGPFAAAAFGAVGTNIMLGAVRGFFNNTEGHLITEIGKSFTWVLGSLGGLIPSFGNKLLGKLNKNILAPVKDFFEISLPNIFTDIKVGNFKGILTTIQSIGVDFSKF